MDAANTPHYKLVQYVKKNLAKGYPVDTLKYALLSQGYGRTAVQKAIEDATKQEPQQSLNQPVSKDKPKITYSVLDEDSQEDYNSSRIYDDEEPGFFKKLWDKIWE